MASNKHQLKLKNPIRRDIDDDDIIYSSDNFELSDEPNLAQVAPPPPPASASGGKPYKRKKYNKHNNVQIHDLESFFKKCPHPDEKQRIALGKKLGMDSKQVKFWFQNRRTKMKTRLERNEIALLKQDFDKLRLENMTIKEYMYKPVCKDCGGGVLEISMEEHRLRLDNARIKQELIRVSKLAEKVAGKLISEMPDLFFESKLGLPTGEPSVLASGRSNSLGFPKLEELIDTLPPSTCVVFSNYKKYMHLQIANAAMNELVFLAKSDCPYWLKSLNGGFKKFNYSEYANKFNHYRTSFPGFSIEATRDCGLVIISSLELIDILMQPGRWVDMFPCMVGKASIVSVLCNGVDGTHDGELQLLEAGLLFPSPFVPMRWMRFIRYCKKYSENAWVVVDISVDPIQEVNTDITRRCRRMPSSFFILKDDTNIFSLVTCVEHVEYDKRVVRSLFRPLVQSGYGFGAHRWLATLQRQCEYAAYLPVSRSTPLESSIGITPKGKNNLLKLTRRIVNDFCGGVCDTFDAKWKVLNLGDMASNLQIMTRINIDKHGEVLGMVLSFSTALLVPVPRHKVFDFLRSGQLRGFWDILVKDGPMEETVRITKSNNSANSVSILYPLVQGKKESKMAILQETWVDKTASVVVYSAVDISSITQVMEGGNPDLINLLPSGLVITYAFMDPSDGRSFDKTTSSLLTLGFQVLMNTSPTTTLTLGSIETIKENMEQTINKIKIALCCE